MQHSFSPIPLITQAQKTNATHTAIIDCDNRYTYQDLLDASAKIATLLLDGKDNLAEARVAYLVPSTFDYPAVQWGIWRAGGIAVPLCTMHPASELAYVIEDSDASIVIAHPQYEEILRPVAEKLNRRFLLTTELQNAEVGKDRKSVV